MPVSTDFSLDTTNQIIKHTSGTTVYTSRQLYSQIQDWMDDATYMDFTPPMSAQTPTDFQVINGWYLDEGCIEWLNGGAITTSGYVTAGIYKLTMSSSGYTNPVSGDIGKTVQNGGVTHTGTLLAYNNTTKVWWIRAVTSVFTTEAVTISGGTGAGTITAVATGEMAFPNIYTLGSIDTTGSEQQIYVVQNEIHLQIWGGSGTSDPTPGSGQQIDVLVKTQDAGTAIASGNLTIFLRNYPSAGTSLPTHQVDLYDNFSLSALSGRNAVPLATSGDLNNTHGYGSSAPNNIETYSDVGIYFINGQISYSAISGTFTNFETVTGGTSGATAKFIAQTTSTGAGTMTLANITGTFQSAETLTGGTSAKTATTSSTLTLNDSTRVYGEAFTQDVSHNYSVIIDCATRTLAQVYEYLKYVTRQNSTFSTYEVQKTGASTWIIDKKNGEQYILAFEDFNVTTNSFSPVKAAPFGTFAGGKMFAAQGVWLQNMAAADAKNFQLIDSAGTVRNPPNFVNVAISSLATGDSISVFVTSSGTTINKGQYLAAAGNTSGNGTFVVQGSISTDTPSTGFIRVVKNSTSPATEQRYYYSSWTASTFTLAAHTDGYNTALSSTLTQTYTATTDTAYIGYLDDEVWATGHTPASVPVLSGPGSDGFYTATVSVIYSSDRTVLARVRRYNGAGDTLIPFQTTGTFSSSGYSTSAIRTADTIAT